MARPDLDPAVVEALARAHQQHVIDTYKLYGQRNGIDQPEEFDRLPFSVGRQVVSQVFELFVCALVMIMVVGLSLSGGPIP